MSSRIDLKDGKNIPLTYQTDQDYIRIWQSLLRKEVRRRKIINLLEKDYSSE